MLKGFLSIVKKGNIGIKIYLENIYWIIGNFGNEFIVVKENIVENVNSLLLYFWCWVIFLCINFVCICIVY